MLVPFLRGMARNGKVVHLKDEFQDRTVKGCEKLGVKHIRMMVGTPLKELRPSQSGMVILLLFGYTFHRGDPDTLLQADVSSSGPTPSLPPSLAGRSNRSPVCNPPQWRRAQSPLTKKQGGECSVPWCHTWAMAQSSKSSM